jgi:iron complex transport system substrate-binding protein
MTRIITDMAGREVEIPNKISRIYAPSPYGSAILASIAPDLMVGTMLPIEAEAKKFLPSSLHNLPVIGKYSETQAIMDARVDLILLWAEKAAPFHKKSEQALTPLGIPFIYAVLKDLVDLRDYAPFGPAVGYVAALPRTLRRRFNRRNLIFFQNIFEHLY